MSRYTAAPSQPAQIDRHRIPGGLDGTRTTAAHVCRLICAGAGDFYVRQKAIDILLECGVPAKDYLGEIDALFRWVQRHVRYTKDPFRIEVLHSARRMLELRAGDCDDMTIVLGALIKSVGHPVRIVLTGPDRSRPDLFSHIYLEARHHDQWIPLDATMPYGMGWSPRTPVRQVLSIEEEHSDARTATATRTATPSSADPAAGAGPRARARLASRPAARHWWSGRAAQGSTRQSIVESAAQAAVTRVQPMGPHESAIHLAEGTQRAGAAAHHRAIESTAQQSPARDRRPVAAASVAARLSAPDAGAVTDAPPAAGGGASRRHAASGSQAAPSGGGTEAPGNCTASRPLATAVRSAAALYKTFTQMPARSIERVPHARVMPPVVLELGQLAGLVYRSSKWVGRPRTYIHFMDDPPRLVSDPSGRRLFIVGGSYRVTARGIEG